MSNSLTITVGGKPRHFFSVNKLGAALQGGGESLWINKSDQEVDYITGRDTDGNDYVVRKDTNGNIIKTKLPFAIRIVALPTIIDPYSDNPDYTGMIVKAYDENGQIWENESYPGGMIPLNELNIEYGKIPSYEAESILNYLGKKYIACKYTNRVHVISQKIWSSKGYNKYLEYGQKISDSVYTYTEKVPCCVVDYVSTVSDDNVQVYNKDAMVCIRVPANVRCHLDQKADVHLYFQPEGARQEYITRYGFPEQTGHGEADRYIPSYFRNAVVNNKRIYYMYMGLIDGSYAEGAITTVEPLCLTSMPKHIPPDIYSIQLLSEDIKSYNFGNPSSMPSDFQKNLAYNILYGINAIGVTWERPFDHKLLSDAAEINIS